jgi:hypothetical protein
VSFRSSIKNRSVPACTVFVDFPADKAPLQTVATHKTADQIFNYTCKGAYPSLYLGTARPANSAPLIPVTTPRVA